MKEAKAWKAKSFWPFHTYPALSKQIILDKAKMNRFKNGLHMLNT